MARRDPTAPTQQLINGTALLLQVPIDIVETDYIGNHRAGSQEKKKAVLPILQTTSADTSSDTFYNLHARVIPPLQLTTNS